MPPLSTALGLAQIIHLVIASLIAGRFLTQVVRWLGQNFYLIGIFENQFEAVLGMVLDLTD